MFVITADQIDSRTDVDRSPTTLTSLNERFAADLVLPADQTAGDEIQVLTTSGSAAFEIVLDLSRSGAWSIGLGVGAVRHPLPDAARKATGPAFFAARDAIDAAKRSEPRFALRAAEDSGLINAADVEPYIRLLLVLHARRSAQAWEVIDLVATGMTQKRAAEHLGISAAAVSQRLKAAMWSIDDDAHAAIVKLLDVLNVSIHPDLVPG